MADIYAKIVGGGKHITIHEQSSTPISYLVTPRLKSGWLGWIRWYGPWKQWCFLPCEGTVWSTDCLEDVVKFISQIATKPKTSAVSAPSAVKQC